MRTEKLFDLIFPKGLTCNACGKELDDGEREYSLCSVCSSTLTAAGEPREYGGVMVYSCFKYEGIVRSFVLDYKDSDSPYLTEYMAKYLRDAYIKYGLSADRVCYVPTSPSGLVRRGYDGMRYVAEYFSALVGVPVDHSLFRRDGEDQTKVAHGQRRANVKNAFLSRGAIEGKIILLDDVVTSGATVETCAQAILAHGASEVIVLTFARA